MNVIGNGVALDPEMLMREIWAIQEKGVSITPENLKISDRASLLLPWHRKQDALEEARLGAKQYGSSKLGIAPFYSDKYQKKTVLAGALFYPGVINRIHELLGGDFYVLPSSVHELILIAVDDQDPQQLADLVRSANRSVVRHNEILANDLFICESGKLCRVSFGGVIPDCGDYVC